MIVTEIINACEEQSLIHLRPSRIVGLRTVFELRVAAMPHAKQAIFNQTSAFSWFQVGMVTRLLRKGIQRLGAVKSEAELKYFEEEMLGAPWRDLVAFDSK